MSPYISDDFEDSMDFAVPEGGKSRPKENQIHIDERRMFEELAKISKALRAQKLMQSGTNKDKKTKEEGKTEANLIQRVLFTWELIEYKEFSDKQMRKYLDESIQNNNYSDWKDIDLKDKPIYKSAKDIF